MLNVHKVFFVLSALLSFNCMGQKVYTKKQVKEDLNVLREIVVETDPALSKENKTVLNADFKKQIAAFDEPSTTEFEFVQYLKKIRSDRTVGLDEHASLQWTNSLPDSILLFPVPMEIIDSCFIVNSDSVSIPFGSIILSINNENIQTILEKMNGGKVVGNTNRFELRDQFSVMYYALYGNLREFTVTYKLKPDSPEIKSTVIKAVDARSYVQLMSTSVYPLNKDNWLNYSYTGYSAPLKTYYLRLNSFENFNTKFFHLKKDTVFHFNTVYDGFKMLFDSIFADIKNKHPENLIIDIRNNGGGDANIPGLLLSYIYDKNFTDVQKLRMPLISNIPLNNLTGFDYNTIDSKTVARKKLDTVYAAFHKAGDYYVLNKCDTIIPNQNVFKGNLYLLVNGGTFSGASYFTALFKYYTQGKIIGEELGGSHLNLTAGHTLNYELPNTKLKVNMPIMFINFGDSIAAEIPEKYIKPDVSFPFKLKYEYFIGRSDVDLNETFRIIYNNLNKK